LVLPQTQSDDRDQTASHHSLTRSSPLSGSLTREAPSVNAIETKKTQEQLAERELQLRLGRRYVAVVRECLRCLDLGTGIEEDGKGFGIDDNQKEFLDEDGVVIGVRFIEHVLEKMQDITI
jgi:hypothetical protein